MNTKKQTLGALYFLFGTVFALISSQSSFAQTYKVIESPRKQIIYFDLPSQPLKSGLIEFAIQSKLTVIVDTDTVEGFRSKPIVGPYYPENALKLLLSKSPLSYTVLDDTQSVLIRQAMSTTQIEPSLNIQGPNESEKSEQVEEIIVRGTQYPYRYNTISNTQIYGNTSSFSSARFINVLPASLANDQKPDDLSDLLKLSSGITPSDGFADSNDDFFVRGFPRYGVYLDGFRLSNSTGIKIFPETIDQVEILKGPSTLFYGQAEPGGIINVVRKRPQGQSQHTLNMAYGDGNEQRINIDLTGPLFNANSHLLYRLVATQMQQNKFRDLTDVKRDQVSSSITWNISDHTTINGSYDKQDAQQSRDQGTLILAPLREGVDVASVDAPISQARPNFSAEQSVTSFDVQHYFETGWSLKSSYLETHEKRLGIRANREALYSTNFLLGLDDLIPANIIIVDGIYLQGTEVSKRNQWLPVALIHSIYDEENTEKSRAFKTLLSGNYELGTKTNDITLGFNWETNRLDEKYVLEYRSDIQSLSLADRNTSDIVDAVTATFVENPGLGDLQTKYQILDYTDYGIFVLNHTDLNDKWRLSLGGRYTVAEGKRTVSEQSFENLAVFKQFSSELGLFYQATDNTGFYLNYSEGFKANYQIDDLATPVDKPELSTQRELGIKSLLLNDALTATVAVFDIDKKNVVDIEFIEGIRNASLTGEQSSTGLDMDFSYQINANLNLLGSLSIIDPTIKSGDYRGKVPALASKQVASTFIYYRFNEGWAKGLSFNTGAYRVGERFANNDNSSESKIDAFTTVDFGSAYEWNIGNHALKVQLSVKNALDEHYLLATEGRIRSDHGAERRVIGALSIDF